MVTPISIVTVCPLLSLMIAVQLAGLPLLPPFFAVTVNEVPALPGPGDKVAQFPPADESSVVLQVSLFKVNVDAGDSFGVSVAVSPAAVNCADPALVIEPRAQASALELHVTATVSAPGFGVGVGVGFVVGDGLGDGLVVGDELGDGFVVGVGLGDGVGGRMPPEYTPSSYESFFAKSTGGLTLTASNVTVSPLMEPRFPTVVQTPCSSAARRSVPAGTDFENVIANPGICVSFALPLIAVIFT